MIESWMLLLGVLGVGPGPNPTQKDSADSRALANEPPPPAAASPDARDAAEVSPDAGALEPTVEAPSADEITREALSSLVPDRVLTLEECLQTARARSLDLDIARGAVDEADAARKAARGRFGPVVQVDASVQVWADEVTVNFTPPGLMIDVDPVVVQDQVTSRASVSLIQPLTGLWGITEAHRAAKLGKRAAAEQRSATGIDVDLAVTSAYYDALKSERLVVVAAVSIAAIEALLERSRALARAGALGREQVLETEVRLAEARSLLIQARGGVKLARASLAFAMGLPIQTDLGPAPISIRPLSSATASEAERSDALRNRPDVSALRTRAEQAKLARKITTSAMLPQLNAMASYQRTDGQSFALNDQFFVGLTLNWSAWTWGSKYYQIPQARARERQARSAVAKMEQGVSLEIAVAQTGLETASQRLIEARTAIGAATENLRLVTVRFNASAATATQVLDAVRRKAGTEATEATSYYDVLKAQAALRKALGQPINPSQEKS